MSSSRVPIEGLIDRQIYRLNKTLTIEILLTVEVRTDCVQRWTLNSATRDPIEARQGVTRDPRPLNLPGAGATLQHQHKICSTSRKHRQPTGSIRGAGNLGSLTRRRRQTLWTLERTQGWIEQSTHQHEYKCMSVFMKTHVENSCIHEFFGFARAMWNPVLGWFGSLLYLFSSWFFEKEK